MLLLGRYNDFTITRFTDHGAYVDGGLFGEILVPKNYVQSEWRPGTQVRLFLYLDQSERLVATSESPLAQEGDFAYLQVSWVNEHGAFLHWGVMKDLFVPFREQKQRMQNQRAYIVHIFIDSETQRLVATAKVDRYLSAASPNKYARGEAVDLLVWQRTDLGLKVIVDNAHAGLIYNDQLPNTEPRTGQRLRGYVVQTRPDGRLDISLQALGVARFRDFAEQLLEQLQNSEQGFLPFTDKSEAKEIMQHFGVSKKTFKRAVGTLYAARQIRIAQEGIYLL